MFRRTSYFFRREDSNISKKKKWLKLVNSVNHIETYEKREIDEREKGYRKYKTPI